MTRKDWKRRQAEHANETRDLQSREKDKCHVLSLPTIPQRYLPAQLASSNALAMQEFDLQLKKQKSTFEAARCAVFGRYRATVLNPPPTTRHIYLQVTDHKRPRRENP